MRAGSGGQEPWGWGLMSAAVSVLTAAELTEKRLRWQWDNFKK